MTSRFVLPLLGLISLSALVACPPTPSGTPTKTTINGYTFADKTAGKVNFSVSALDASNNVITSGTISNPTLSGLTSTVGTATATAIICGQITTQGAVTCVITLDATGSMASSDPPTTAGDLTTTRRNIAAKEFVTRMTTSDRAAVASFDTDTNPTAPYLAIKLHQTFSADKTALRTAVNNATFTGGLTNLWDAVYDNANLLATTSGGNKVALVLTDGANNSSSKSLTNAIDNANAKSTRVFLIGLGSATNDTDMQKLAADTNGLFAHASDASELSTLFNNMFNATQGAGCIQVTFLVNGAPPAVGTKITGTLTMTVNNATLSAQFTVTF